MFRAVDNCPNLIAFEVEVALFTVTSKFTVLNHFHKETILVFAFAFV